MNHAEACRKWTTQQKREYMSDFAQKLSARPIGVNLTVRESQFLKEYTTCLKRAAGPNYRSTSYSEAKARADAFKRRTANWNFWKSGFARE